MKYTPALIGTLIVCGFCIASVSAVPVIVGFRDAPTVRAGSPGGISPGDPIAIPESWRMPSQAPF